MTRRKPTTPPPTATADSGVRVYRADLEKDFRPDPRNANRGTTRGREMLDLSLADLGAARSIVADADGVVPAGNKTREALIAAGVTEAIVVETDGKTPVVVKRTDWHLSDEAPDNPARRYAYADNRVAQVDLDWDPRVIEADIKAGMELEGYFSRDELERMDVLEPPHGDAPPPLSTPKVVCTFPDIETFKKAETELKAFLERHGATYSVAAGVL